mmetsp:Transcript_8585/g.18151  ORF Transcript_8585/g.18151 Transcript_8585/m.18151 type:complete len:94 (-) Transcript_8585:224-505(-)
MPPYGIFTIEATAVQNFSDFLLKWHPYPEVAAKRVDELLFQYEGEVRGALSHMGPALAYLRSPHGGRFSFPLFFSQFVHRDFSSCHPIITFVQ